MRLLVLFVALSLSLSGVCASSDPLIDPEAPEEVQAAAMDLMLNRVVLEVWITSKDDGQLELPDSPVTLREFVRTMPRLYRDHITERDPWSSDYMIGTTEGLGLWIGSGGEDLHLGSIEGFEAAQEAPEINRGWRDLKVFIEDDVVVVDREVVYGPMTDLDRVKRTMSDVRSIGTAIESFSIDENSYPIQDSDLAPVTAIEGVLEPLYIRTLPVFDGWGNPYLVWSNGSQYIVLSMGADGLLDPTTRSGIPGAQARGGPTTDPNADIVFANGQFTQWLEGRQQ